MQVGLDLTDQLQCLGAEPVQRHAVVTCSGVVKCCVKATLGDSSSSVTVGSMQCSGTRVSLSTNIMKSPTRTSPPARNACSGALASVRWRTSCSASYWSNSSFCMAPLPF